MSEGDKENEKTRERERKRGGDRERGFSWKHSDKQAKILLYSCVHTNKLQRKQPISTNYRMKLYHKNSN